MRYATTSGNLQGINPPLRLQSPPQETQARSRSKQVLPIPYPQTGQQNRTMYPPLLRQRRRSPSSRSIAVSVAVQVEVVVEVVEDLEEVHPQGMAMQVEILATTTVMATVLETEMIGAFATRTVVGVATAWMELTSDGR